MLGGYRKHLEAAAAPAPLTAEEYEKQLIMEAEAEVGLGVRSIYGNRFSFFQRC